MKSIYRLVKKGMEIHFGQYAMSVFWFILAMVLGQSWLLITSWELALAVTLCLIGYSVLLLAITGRRITEHCIKQQREGKPLLVGWAGTLYVFHAAVCWGTLVVALAVR